MNSIYSVDEEPATPEYVLAVFRACHGQTQEFDPGDESGFDLTMGTTVAQWWYSIEGVGWWSWRRLRRAFNKAWKIHCSDDEWREALEPAREKTLSGVCALIARHAKRPRIRPSRLLGSDCAPAGAFLTIRSLLVRAGADVKGIKPSTDLGPYTRRFPELLIESIIRFAPDALPSVRVRRPVADAGCLGFLIGLGCLIVNTWLLSVSLSLSGDTIMILSGALIGVAAALPPASVEFGDLRTFRDLATAVADGNAGH